MRVAIIGAGGVGKTTLLERLFQDSWIKNNFLKIPEVVRTLCAERGYNSPYDIPEDQVHKFRLEILEKQIALENEHQNFIVDRSCLDAWIYFKHWSYKHVDKEFRNQFYKLAYDQCQKYDLLIYLPKLTATPADGFRWVNEDYQNLIDKEFQSGLKKWGMWNKCTNTQYLTT